MNTGSKPGRINIFCHNWLEAGTIIVSPDIYEQIKKQFGVEELDEKFLRALGITIGEPPKEEGNG